MGADGCGIAEMNRWAHVEAVRSEALWAMARLDGTVQRVTSLETHAEEKQMILLRLQQARADLVQMIRDFDRQVETLQQERHCGHY